MKHVFTMAPRGYLMLTALVFGAVFLTVLGALSSFVLSENRLQTSATAKSRGVAIAEAGLEYYRWHLAHFPTDLQNGTGAAGPYTLPYKDPEGTQTGTITLTVTGNTACGQTTSIDLTSKGTPTENTNEARTLTARYARPTVAEYSYILNSSVWAGSDRVILGPYHSNGGIRMDGTANSPVTSSLSTWSCNSTYGCSPTQSSAPGVVGNGTNQTLWDYPTPQVDFAAISANFSSLKTTANASGKYYNDGASASFSKGIHIIFNSDGTITIKKVTSVTPLNDTPVNSSTDRGNTDYSVINGETTIGTYAIPSTCGLIFIEDNAWVEGTITGKVTLVVADTATGGSADAILRNNITYSAYDGTVGLTLIAQHDVLVAANSPTDMTLNGIFIAQSGAFGRNLIWNSGGTACNATYEPRGTLTILGTTVSNLRTGTKWNGVSGCNADDSAGYQTRIDAYDRRLATDPPPFTPYVSTDYQFVDWREK